MDTIPKPPDSSAFIGRLVMASLPTIIGVLSSILSTYVFMRVQLENQAALIRANTERTEALDRDAQSDREETKFLRERSYKNEIGITELRERYAGSLEVLKTKVGDMDDRLKIAAQELREWRLRK